jgi:hypothetical protein
MSGFDVISRLWKGSMTRFQRQLEGDHRNLWVSKGEVERRLTIEYQGFNALERPRYYNDPFGY